MENPCYSLNSTIDKAPHTIQVAAESLSRQTGGCITILFGVPMLHLGSEVTMLM